MMAAGRKKQKRPKAVVRKRLRAVRRPDGCIRTLVLLAVLFTALYVVLAHSYDDATRKWAFGVICSILAVFLRR